eukprot:TRINITY_DN89175_c0_g1_i1.p4 TRINITY_DN89175_c0_g1~~TRINITY_DN89175_c0_g1_i1.p4  ORF type:complete len:223 (+),score=30.54 TRINITY_DN89175_c0_g1_i1:1614-2282(+)
MSLVPGNVSKWDFRMLREKYSQLNISFDSIFSGIKDIVIKSLITIQPHVCNKLAKSGYLQNQCFDLFGFDILVDDMLKPWLLEVNMSPSLSCASRLDKQIKTALLCDVFHLIGIQTFVHEEQKVVKKGNEKTGPKLFNPYLDYMKEDTVLSEKDLKLLIGIDEESRRCGGFERIFPLRNNWQNYAKYFECQRYNDCLLWKYVSADCDVLEKYKVGYCSFMSR